MATAQRREREQANEVKQCTRDALHSVIAEQVMHTLGKPAGVQQRLQVRSLWGDFFRVNVLVGDDVVSLKIAASYFLRTDGEGKIVESSPEILRQTSTSPI